MKVVRLRLKTNQGLFGKVYFAGEIMYSTDQSFRKEGSTKQVSCLYDSNGNQIGIIDGLWYDFDNKQAFERAED